MPEGSVSFMVLTDEMSDEHARDSFRLAKTREKANPVVKQGRKAADFGIDDR